MDQRKNFKVGSSRNFGHVLVCNISLYWLSFLRQTDNRKGKIQNNPYLLVKICHHGEKHGAFIKIIHLVRRLLNTKEDIQQRRRDQIVDEYSFKVHPFLITQMSSPISYLFCITHRKRFYLLRAYIFHSSKSVSPERKWLICEWYTKIATNTTQTESKYVDGTSLHLQS